MYMDDYKEMYMKLFQQITETIQQLQAVQQEAEEIFLQQEPDESISQSPSCLANRG